MLRPGPRGRGTQLEARGNSLEEVAVEVVLQVGDLAAGEPDGHTEGPEEFLVRAEVQHVGARYDVEELPRHGEGVRRLGAGGGVLDAEGEGDGLVRLHEPVVEQVSWAEPAGAVGGQELDVGEHAAEVVLHVAEDAVAVQQQATGKVLLRDLKQRHELPQSLGVIVAAFAQTIQDVGDVDGGMRAGGVRRRLGPGHGATLDAPLRVRGGVRGAVEATVVREDVALQAGGQAAEGLGRRLDRLGLQRFVVQCDAAEQKVEPAQLGERRPHLVDGTRQREDEVALKLGADDELVAAMHLVVGAEGHGALRGGRTSGGGEERHACEGALEPEALQHGAGESESAVDGGGSEAGADAVEAVELGLAEYDELAPRAQHRGRGLAGVVESVGTRGCPPEELGGYAERRQEEAAIVAAAQQHRVEQGVAALQEELPAGSEDLLWSVEPGEVVQAVGESLLAGVRAVHLAALLRVVEDVHEVEALGGGGRLGTAARGEGGAVALGDGRGVEVPAGALQQRTLGSGGLGLDVDAEDLLAGGEQEAQLVEPLHGARARSRREAGGGGGLGPLVVRPELLRNRLGGGGAPLAEGRGLRREEGDLGEGQVAGLDVGLAGDEQVASIVVVLPHGKGAKVGLACISGRGPAEVEGGRSAGRGTGLQQRLSQSEALHGQRGLLLRVADEANVYSAAEAVEQHNVHALGAAGGGGEDAGAAEGGRLANEAEVARLAQLRHDVGVAQGEEGERVGEDAVEVEHALDELVEAALVGDPVHAQVAGLLAEHADEPAVLVDADASGADGKEAEVGHVPGVQEFEAGASLAPHAGGATGAGAGVTAGALSPLEGRPVGDSRSGARFPELLQTVASTVPPVGGGVSGGRFVGGARGDLHSVAARHGAVELVDAVVAQAGEQELAALGDRRHEEAEDGVLLHLDGAELVLVLVEPAVGGQEEYAAGGAVAHDLADDVALVALAEQDAEAEDPSLLVDHGDDELRDGRDHEGGAAVERGEVGAAELVGFLALAVVEVDGRAVALQLEVAEVHGAEGLQARWEAEVKDLGSAAQLVEGDGVHAFAVDGGLVVAVDEAEVADYTHAPAAGSQHFGQWSGRVHGADGVKVL
ncbi:uncharacterized protein BcabD6B2_15830 [Babesia caballi]|uniref:Uncharacterized protein n=1 Tax=Babesia caballi TaxID=5871 RepID=A0AAV4LR02_BABCB|nr:hypothetical protein BcabD6B2_15830 [Babesia caballi]